jgi:hypothetical protein
VVLLKEARPRAEVLREAVLVVRAVPEVQEEVSAAAGVLEALEASPDMAVRA